MRRKSPPMPLLPLASRSNMSSLGRSTYITNGIAEFFKSALSNIFCTEVASHVHIYIPL